MLPPIAGVQRRIAADLAEQLAVADAARRAAEERLAAARRSSAHIFGMSSNERSCSVGRRQAWRPCDTDRADVVRRQPAD